MNKSRKKIEIVLIPESDEIIEKYAIEVVQQLMGHSDIKTTQIYAMLVDEYKHQTLLNAWKRV